MNYKKFILVSFIIVFLDQFLKYLIINNVINLPYIKNTGAAFGILKSFNTELILFSIIVIGVLLYTLDTVENKYAFFIALLLGGIVGNLIDRIYFGGVIDFIDIGLWPAFNIADLTISVGIFGILLKSFQNSSASSILFK